MYAAAAAGTAGFAGRAASFLGNSLKFFGKGFTNSFTGTSRALLTGKAPVDFFTAAGPWKSYIASGIISVPTALMNLTNFFEDGRRMREIASGQSNFYTDRNAATKTWGLSTLGLAGSAALGVGGILAGAAAATPVGMALTAASGIVATGSLISRQVYKKFTLDLPFKPNAGFGLLSMNSPLLRVKDPSSPYYMYSQLLEKTVKNRQAQDQNGKLYEGYLKAVEETGLKAIDYLI